MFFYYYFKIVFKEYLATCTQFVRWNISAPLMLASRYVFKVFIIPPLMYLIPCTCDEVKRFTCSSFCHSVLNQPSCGQREMTHGNIFIHCMNRRENLTWWRKAALFELFFLSHFMNMVMVYKSICIQLKSLH